MSRIPTAQEDATWNAVTGGPAIEEWERRGRPASQPDDTRLPRADASERYLIGALVAFPELAGDVLRRVRPTDFLDATHRAIVAAFARQHAAGGVDPVLVGRECECAGYLLELAGDVTTAVHVEAKAAKIVEARRKRQLHEIADHAARSALNGRPAESVLYELRCAIDDFRREARTIDGQPPDVWTFGDLHRVFTTQKPVLIDGLLRRGEVMNIIASPKVGKSWFVYHVALCVITGRPILRRFTTTPARVLLCDNELHPETLSVRIPLVADAMGVEADEYQHDLHVRTLRGNLRSFTELADEIEAEATGDDDGYGLIVFDAKYRFATPGQSENDNASEALFYNRADQLAVNTGAAVAFVHHLTKGSQSEKRVSDLGAGAGSQSRAADVHAALREHEDEGAYVFEALVRSFAPVAPVGVRWMFPLWVADDGIDPKRLRRTPTASDEKQADRDREGVNALIDALRKDGPATARQLRGKTGLSRERQQRLLDKLTASGDVVSTKITIRGNETDEYSLPKDPE